METGRKVRTSTIAIASLGFLGSLLLGAYVYTRVRAQEHRHRAARLIDEILERLRDGRWHNAHSIAGELNQPEERIRKALRFCEEFGFVTLDERGENARLSEGSMEILDQPSAS